MSCKLSFAEPVPLPMRFRQIRKVKCWMSLPSSTQGHQAALPCTHELILFVAAVTETWLQHHLGSLGQCTAPKDIVALSESPQMLI